LPGTWPCFWGAYYTQFGLIYRDRFAERTVFRVFRHSGRFANRHVGKNQIPGELFVRFPQFAIAGWRLFFTFAYRESRPATDGQLGEFMGNCFNLKVA